MQDSARAGNILQRSTAAD